MVIPIFIDNLPITACKQYCLAAGATQGNIAYTKTVSTHFMTTAERVKTRRKELKRFLLMDDKRNDIY